MTIRDVAVWIGCCLLCIVIGIVVFIGYLAVLGQSMGGNG